MNCNIVNDLIPLYIDGCCSEESKSAVEAHIQTCKTCKRVYKEMSIPSELISETNAPTALRKLKDWQASILQSVLLFISFGLITIGVALEAASPSGLLNGFWAFNVVIPATGFLLSLPNWYFVRVYKSKKAFSTCSLLITLGLILCAFIWALGHYDIKLLGSNLTAPFSEMLHNLLGLFSQGATGISLTIVFCILSKALSNLYAKMLGKD